MDVALISTNETGAKLITAAPPESAYTNKWIQQALDELADEGLDLTGEKFTPIEVTLKAGGK